MRDENTQVDLLGIGVVFDDIILANLPSGGIKLGDEIWTNHIENTPGGIANILVTASRLGLTTKLYSIFGDDCRSKSSINYLNCNNISTEDCTIETNTQLPTTISLIYDNDRALVTGDKCGWQNKMTTPPTNQESNIIFVDGLSLPCITDDMKSNSKVIIGCGAEQLTADHTELFKCLQSSFAFICNATEARQLSGKSTLNEQLEFLLTFVNKAVITQGPQGIAGQVNGQQAIFQPALDITPIDTTGAGDAAIGAFIAAENWKFTFPQQLAFSVLVSGLSTTGLGGAQSAPTIPKLKQWLHTHPDHPIATKLSNIN